MKLYFGEDDACYNIEYHLEYMREHHIAEMDVFLAKRETNTGYFFCKHYKEVGEKSEGTCGKSCQAYKPRNRKSGACIFLGCVYEQTDICVSLKIDKWMK